MKRKIVSLLCALSVFSTICVPLKSAQAISLSDFTNAISSKIADARSMVVPYSSAIKSTVRDFNLGSYLPIKIAAAQPASTNNKQRTIGLSSSISSIKNSLTTKATNFTTFLNKSLNGISLSGLTKKANGLGNTISNTVNSKLITINSKIDTLNSKFSLNTLSSKFGLSTLNSISADLGNAIKGFSPIGIASAASVSAKNYDKGRLKTTSINKVSLDKAKSRSWDSELVRAGGSSKSGSMTSQYQREQVLGVLDKKDLGFFGRLELSSNQGKSKEKILQDLDRDYSGGVPIWNSLNDAEQELCFKHPTAAPVVFACKELADRQVKRFYGSNVDGTESNAFRHACWNAFMTLYLGEDLAEEFATAHEALGDDIMNEKKADGYTYREHCKMDLYNNEVGRSCVLQGEDISWDEVGDRVKHKAKTGKLKVLVK